MKSHANRAKKLGVRSWLSEISRENHYHSLCLLSTVFNALLCLMIGIIIGANAENYGWPLRKKYTKFIYCHVPARRGLRRTALALGSDETRTRDPLVNGPKDP